MGTTGITQFQRDGNTITYIENGKLYTAIITGDNLTRIRELRT